MSAPFPNLYTLRKVAEVSAKACDICYKPSTSVLITPDSKDFFFVCAVHLKDKYFCTPKVDEAAAKARREKELAEETEKLKKEYEEKQKKKKEKEKEKEAKDKDKKKDDDKDKDADKDKDKKDDKKDDAKDGDEDSKDSPADTPEPESRIFELKSAFYQQRLQKKRQAEASKRDKERVSQPGYFPSVPSGPPTK